MIFYGNDFISPILGARKKEYIAENQSAEDVILTDGEFKNMQQELDKITIYDNRTDEDIAKERSKS
ncbi:hypothetical protein [Chryseobacterium taiwanense]|uniref:hypothetical protein n=1 Tax=Chryseobacterium taiwanense TaxID=363331 RepID=UPI0013F452C5|nr:hypothetical protein [Chryseobacterium taiwanense]